MAMLLCSMRASSQMVVVKPQESNRVLTNPGIGFTTFQRFNGDPLNAGTGWTEGMPIQYGQATAAAAAPGYPDTTIAYLRLYWRFFEPAKGQYDWALLDKALQTASQRGQTLMLRIAPHGTQPAEDVPAWYRAETGEKLQKDRPKTNWESKTAKWMIDPENPAYAREFGALIRELGRHYDGDPRLNLVDISFLAAWGEGAGSELLSEKTRNALLDSYIGSFHKTPLVTQLGDPASVAHVLAKARNSGTKDNPAAPLVGWRADCLGDMGGFDPKRNLMIDSYPEAIADLHVGDLWKEAPVSMESCWVMQHWKDQGWSLKYIVEQAIKWHVSSFNNKSSAVPEAWWPEVNEWLRHMGYRFVLRRFAFPSEIDPSRRFTYESWWENKGNAPVYKAYTVTLRFTDRAGSWTVPLDDDPRRWLPGDIVHSGDVYLPREMEAGDYQIAIALTDPITRQPQIHLAVEGERADGWFPLGAVKLKSEPSNGSPVIR
jgi:hypothetical protein